MAGKWFYRIWIREYIGWVNPYLVFRSISGKKTEAVNPQIGQKFDESYAICEKGTIEGFPFAATCFETGKYRISRIADGLAKYFI